MHIVNHNLTMTYEQFNIWRVFTSSRLVWSVVLSHFAGLFVTMLVLISCLFRGLSCDSLAILFRGLFLYFPCFSCDSVFPNFYGYVERQLGWVWSERGLYNLVQVRSKLWIFLWWWGWWWWCWRCMVRKGLNNLVQVRRVLDDHWRWWWWWWCWFLPKQAGKSR